MIYSIKNAAGLFLFILCTNLLPSAFAQSGSNSYVNPHCNEGLYGAANDGPFSSIQDLVGPVKNVKVKKSRSELVFNVSKSGNVINKSEKNDYLQSAVNSVYSYDSNGRIASVTSDFSGGTEIHYEYPGKGEVVEVSKWSYQGIERWGVHISKLFAAPDGVKVCINALLYKGGTLYNGESSLVIYTPKGFLHLPLRNSEFPNHDQPVFDFQQGMDSLRAYIEDAYISRSKMLSRCGVRLVCYGQEENVDGKLTSVDAGTLNPGGQPFSIIQRFWKDLKGNLVDSISAHDQKLSNGDYPHHRISYHYDSHGNWIRREEFVQKDTPKGIKYIKADRFDLDVTRGIEYYQN